jgi:exodeoxyribonuclease-3
VRLATWNVNGLRARLGFLGIWLRERQPDVVGLQELKVEDEERAREELRALGYESVVNGQRAWNGVAILARRALGVPSETARDLPGQEALGARLVAADIGDLSFTTIYVPNGKAEDHEDFPRKLAWLDALAEHVQRSVPGERPAFLCGDFNLCPSPLDSWNEEAFAGTLFHTDAERARFRRLEQAGLRDVFRDAHPDARVFSWWDYRGGAFHQGRGLRIDLALANAALAPRVRDVFVDRDFRKKKEGLLPSDHAPVIVDLA